jgi:hypothetical protein
MKKYLLVVVSTLVSGCTVSHMSSGLDALMGQPISKAYQVIGYPDSRQDYGSEIVDVWSTCSSGGMVLPQVANTTIQNPSLGTSYGSTVYNTYVPTTAEYQIKIISDKKTGIIQNWEGYGNAYGAERYSRRLYEYYKSTKTNN